MLSELFDDDQQCLYDIPEEFQMIGSNEFFEKTHFKNENPVQTNIFDNDDVKDEYNCSVFYYSCKKDDET